MNSLRGKCAGYRAHRHSKPEPIHIYNTNKSQIIVFLDGI